jgi:hypothetical protein
VKVLYIAGVGRSGSTLLERVLGAVPGSVNLGEVNALFSRVAVQDQRCGCGEAFSRCAFWGEVGEVAFGGWREVSARIAHLQPRVVRQRHVPRLLGGWGPAAYRRELEEYVDTHARLYRAAAQVAGAEVVVDASKSTAQLCALHGRGGLDLRVLNLVRDARGVAHSWEKADLVKAASRTGEPMGTYRPPQLAVLWSALQLECAWLGATSEHATRVRYEDLVAAPRPTVRRALAELGLATTETGLDHVGAHSVTLGASHGVAGSRTRFTHGRIDLALDDVWRTGLAPRARRTVTALTLPQLVSYGYVGRRAHA